MATVALSDIEQENLKETLKRCPKGTYESAINFRETGDSKEIPAIVMGIVERFLEPENKALLNGSNDSLSLFEDLGIDSLTMMEIVMAVEESTGISFKNEELRDIQTLGDVKNFIDSKSSNKKTDEN